MTTQVKITRDGNTVRIALDKDGERIGNATVCGDFLDDVWVAPRQRGRGYGRTLTLAAAVWAKEAIPVVPEMKTLLTSMGWAPSAERPLCWRKPVQPRNHQSNQS